MNQPGRTVPVPENPAPRPTGPAHIDVAVSTVILALRPDDEARLCLWLPLVRRTREPFINKWALPGGWVGERESLENAAKRTLADTTGLRPSYLEQLYTFGHPKRSHTPNQRVVSPVYTALVRNHEAELAAMGQNVKWFSTDRLPVLAFDHSDIVGYALDRLRSKIEYAPVAFHFLDERFSLTQLREVYEAILQKKLDPGNFARWVKATNSITPTGERQTGGRHRPPLLYRALHSDSRGLSPFA